MTLKKTFTFVPEYLRQKSMRIKQKGWLMLFFCVCAAIVSIRAQEQILPPDTVMLPAIHEQADSIPTVLPDALSTHIAPLADSITVDSLLLSNTIQTNSLFFANDTIPAKPGLLEAPVTYQASDSIVLTAGNMAYLFGKGEVKYQQIQLQADRIEMSMDNNVVYATYAIDSTGVETGYPLYIDGQEQVESKSMRYNFKTKKAYAKSVLTQQGEGYLTAEVTKKMEDNTMNMMGGKYTTCDEHDHPHFYIQMTKAKTRPGKNIVSGPLYLVIEDVPLPLGLPFAFFPFTNTYSSGIIMPTYGEDVTKGFFLQNGGYYFAISDYVDLSLTGDIYTKGSWQIDAKSAYRKRYKYSGNFSAGYNLTTLGEKGFSDYSVSKAIRINWSHSQDPKANPFRTFSASINFMTNQFDRNELKGQSKPKSTENTKASSVSINQRFPNSPWSITATMNISQNTRDSTLNVIFPTLMINMSMTAPFKRKNAIGPERWYEKIKLSYSGNLQNSVTSKEYVFFNQNLVRDWKNSMTHQIPVSASFSLFNYINITPSLNYNERWITKKDIQVWDTTQNRLVKDTTLYGFNRVYNYSASVSAGTTLYGMYKPWAIFGGFINMIRHRMEPSISYSFVPGLGNFYNKYSYERNGELIVDYYSPYESPPSRKKQGNISFNVNNNIEAKIRSNQDSTGLKKISLIDNISYGISYDLAADTCNWTNSRVGLRMKLSKSYTLNLNGEFDTYIYAYNETTKTGYRINTPRWKVGKGIGRLRSTSTSFSYTFDNNFINTVKGWFGKKDDTENKPSTTNPSNDNDWENENTPSRVNDNTPATGTRLRTAKKTQTGEYDDNGYYNANVQWSFNISYSMSLRYGKFNPDKMEFDYMLQHNLSFSGNVQPTSKWRLNFSGTYDFDQKKIPYMSLGISRDLHCFQMSASVIPVGDRKSYMFSIAVSSSLLKDLKYDQRSNYWNGQSWY